MNLSNCYPELRISAVSGGGFLIPFRCAPRDGEQVF
jgi:hypothetical protein